MQKFYGIYALILGLLALLNTNLHQFGLATLTVPTHAVLGILGGIWLLKNNPKWKRMLLLWSIGTAIILAIDPSGNMTSHDSLYLGFTYEKSSTFNDTITSLFRIGINVIGIINIILYFVTASVTRDSCREACICDNATTIENA